MRNKLRETAGEALVEALMSMVVTALALLMLAGAIVSSGKLNQTAREKSAFQSAAEAGTPLPVTIRNADGSEKQTVNVTPYQSGGDLTYYEKTTTP